MDWRALLRAFVGRCQRADVTSTRKRRNRKYGLGHPGSKRNYTANILVAVDMSIREEDIANDDWDIQEASCSEIK